jgi:predicted nucleotidyltransferase
MRVAAPPLLPIFRSRLEGELLALVLVDPTRSWTIDELSDRTGHPYQTVATEVRRLQEVELVRIDTVGRTKLLSANESNPYVRPLAQLVLMAFGPPLVISDEFGTVDKIEQLMIYGSWAARYEGEAGPVPNDIDLLVIGRPDRDEVHEAAQRAQQRLGREVNVTLRTRDAWDKATDGFTQQVRSSPLLEVRYPRRDAEVEQGKRGHRAPARSAPTPARAGRRGDR